MSSPEPFGSVNTKKMGVILHTFSSRLGLILNLHLLNRSAYSQNFSI